VNFKKLGIRVHAYIQGPNLVYDDFKDTDWWARDEKGRLITYYRGRKMASIHHDGYLQYVEDKIKGLYGAGFDGVYIDNIQHGQLGVPNQPGKLPFVFCGDASPSARRAFHAETGLEFPDDFEKDLDVTDAYLKFRVRANTQYVARMAAVAHEGGMEFGTNFYDPKFDPTFIYAIDLKAKSDIQDYILFENHSLPSSDGRINNCYVERVIRENEIEKPVFVVSYTNGVGMAEEFSQEDLDNLYSEAAESNFNLCLKGSEFTTGKVWHNLNPDLYTTPRRDKKLPRVEGAVRPDVVQVLLRARLIRAFLKRNYNPLVRVAFEWRLLRFLVNVVYDTVLK
jgi:hypothetical protein